MSDHLEHFGVLGMKWGQRRGKSGGSSGKSFKSMNEKELKDFTKNPNMYGKRNSKRILDEMRKEAYPKEWSTAKKVAVVTGIASVGLLAPLYLAVPFVVGVRIYATHKYQTQVRAREALKKIEKKKVSSLPKLDDYSKAAIAAKDAVLHR